jgi:tol-pal system protein YbgF
MDKLQASLAISLYALVFNTQAALFDDTEARKKILEVEAKSLANHQSQLDKVEDLNKRLDIQSQGMLSMQNEIELLKQEIAELRGALEVANHAVAMADRRQKDLYGDTDARIRKLESGAPVTGVDENGNETSAPAATADADIYKAYKNAYNLSQENKHKEAYEAFDVFIAQYPESKYTPDALYGLGYSQFALKNYQASIATQQKLLSIYPNSAKAPNAMYSIANSQIQLGQINNAKKVLRNLIAKYPSSAVTPNAQARLKVLESIKTDGQ